MKRSIGILILGLVVLARPAGAGVYTQTKGAASLQVSYEGEARKLGLADLITVTLTIEGSPALKTPMAPLDLPPAAPWILVERSKLERASLGPDRVRYQLIYRFGPREPGKQIPFAFPDVKFRDGAKPEQTVSWLPVTFEVETQVVQPDLGSMRDITAVEELPPLVPRDRSWQVWTAVAASLVLLISLAVGLRAWLRRREARTAAQVALYELRRLTAMRLPETGRSERFVTLLTTLVRRYLERRFALPARRLTTPEFLAQLERVPVLDADQKHFLAAFLDRCETVKFAQQTISVDECQQWVDATQRFLQPRSDAPA